jgi:hypothetical protein
MSRRVLVPLWFRYELWLCATGALLWLSGIGYLTSHYMIARVRGFADALHPSEIWWLRLHGAALLGFLVAFGAMIPTHMRATWRGRVNRGSGLSMVSLVVILVVTGYGLYYAADENIRPWISAAHWAIGLAAAAAILLHRALGQRATESRISKSSLGPISDHH